jgi:hypothetical protein
MAEEIRSEAGEFVSLSAKATMLSVARCYDVMAEHLEWRLVQESNSIASGSLGRFAFR